MGKGGHRAWQLACCSLFPCVSQGPRIPHEEETLVLPLWATAKSNQEKLLRAQGREVGF